VLLESNGIYFIECPGCKTLHPFHVDPKHKIRWDFNGDLEKPTFSPSLMVNQGTLVNAIHLSRMGKFNSYLIAIMDWLGKQLIC
jgi:hypothetical protein